MDSGKPYRDEPIKYLCMYVTLNILAILISNKI